MVMFPSTIALLSAPTLGVGDEELKALAFGGCLIFAAVVAVLRTVRRVGETKEREQTRREIAAYVAEGSITPDDAARLLSAGLNETVAAELARGVKWGTVSAAKAQKMVQSLQHPASPGFTPPASPMPPR